MENGRHRVPHLAMDTLNPKFLLETLFVMFDSLKCATKLNVAIGFVLKSDKNGSCRYYYAHDKFTLLERLEFVATTEDLTKINNLLSDTDVVEWCTRVRTNTKWEIYKLTNVSFSASVFTEDPMGVKTLF